MKNRQACQSRSSPMMEMTEVKNHKAQSKGINIYEGKLGEAWPAHAAFIWIT